MTDTRRPATTRRSLTLPVLLAAVTLFVVLALFLGARMAQGRDPALASGKPAQLAPRRILVRKVVITRHITTVRPRPAAAAPSPTPVVVQQAPQVQVAPAQSVPAPAPVQTATS